MIAYFRSSRRRIRWTLGVVAAYALLVVAGPLAGASSACAMMQHASAAAMAKTTPATMPAGHHCPSAETAAHAGDPAPSKPATPPAHDCCDTANGHSAPAATGGAGVPLSGGSQGGGMDCMSAGCSGCSATAGAALPTAVIGPAHLPPPLFAHLGSSVARHDATPSRLLRPPIA